MLITAYQVHFRFDCCRRSWEMTNGSDTLTWYHCMPPTARPTLWIVNSTNSIFNYLFYPHIDLSIRALRQRSSGGSEHNWRVYLHWRVALFERPISTKTRRSQGGSTGGRMVPLPAYALAHAAPDWTNSLASKACSTGTHSFQLVRLGSRSFCGRFPWWVTGWSINAKPWFLGPIF